MFRHRFARKLVLGAGVLGAILIIFGSVWITIIFPRFERIPSDWKQTDELQGSFTFVDEEFLTRLQENPAISQLLKDADAGSLLANPAVKQILDNPATAELINDPQLGGLFSNPDALQLLSDPKLANLLSNPEVLKLLSDPAFLAEVGDPANLPKLLSNPVVKSLLADPNILALLQNPTFLKVLQSGLLATLTTRPELLALLQDPSLGEVLANTAVQRLLSDPEAPSLLTDARTQRLLVNPTDLPMVTVPVLLHRERRATGTQGNKIFINEQVSTLDPTTRQEVPGFDKTDVRLVIDRKSREYLPGTEGGRTGLWGLPFNVKKGRSYSAWVTAAERPLEAEYRGVEKIQGVTTYIHVVDVTDLPMGENDPVTGLPLVVDALITTWSEPRTGSSVNVEDQDALSALDSSGTKYPRFVADVKQTDETTSRLAKKAEDNRNKVLWFGSYMPWMSMGVGIFLTVGAAVIVGAGFIRKRRQTTPPDQQA